MKFFYDGINENLDKIQEFKKSEKQKQLTFRSEIQNYIQQMHSEIDKTGYQKDKEQRQEQ